MSNKHKLLLLLPLFTLLLALFSFTPSVGAAGVCSDSRQTSVPDGLPDIFAIIQFCKDNGGGKPILWERNNTQKCLDGSVLSDAAKREKVRATNDGLSDEDINGAVSRVCRDEGHVGYDPIGKTRCDDGFMVVGVGLPLADIEKVDAWCSDNGHFGYGYEAQNTGNGGGQGNNQSNGPDCSDASVAENLECNQIIKWLRDGVNFLSAGVIIIVIAMIIIGGIQYSYAGGDPNGVAEAKKKIVNAMIALLAYIFLYAFIQYLIPGGIF